MIGFTQAETDAWDALGEAAQRLMVLEPLPQREASAEFDRLELVFRIHAVQDWLLARAALRAGFGEDGLRDAVDPPDEGETR